MLFRLWTAASAVPRTQASPFGAYELAGLTPADMCRNT